MDEGGGGEGEVEGREEGWVGGGGGEGARPRLGPAVTRPTYKEELL